MDSKRFNELAKALASGQSRRGVVKGLAAGLLGSAGALIGRGTDAARTKRGPGRGCREDVNCEEEAICSFNGLRKVCTCAFCYEKCVSFACTPVNSTFAINGSFAINSLVPCEVECTIECSDGWDTCNLG